MHGRSRSGRLGGHLTLLGGRLTLRLPEDLVEAARNAVAHLAGRPAETTLDALAERGIRAELDRLAAAHNRGRPFPPRGTVRPR